MGSIDGGGSAVSDSRDELEAVVLFLSMRVRALEARLAADEPGASTMRAPPSENENPADPSPLIKISVGEAAYFSGLSESQVRKLCEANPLGENGGYGYKKGGRWEVIKDPFLASRGLRMRVSRD